MTEPLVLVIDDDEMILDMLEMAISKAGMAVVTASHGDLGLKVYAEQKPDLAVIDIAMPGIDGYDVVSRIRASEKEHGGRMPIIMLTAHGQPVLRTYATELGADLYLTKPIGPKTLIEHIESLIKG